RLPPRGPRVAPPRGAAFAPAVGIVDRVHRNAAVMRLAAKPTVAAGLADRDVHVIRVRHRTDGAGAAAMNQALFARVQADDHIVLVAADDLRIGAGGACELAALADLEFDIVNDGADRHVTERHHIARLDVDIVAGDDRMANREPRRRQDIGLGAVGVLHQRNEGGAGRIGFQRLDGRGHIDLAALEVDDAVGLLVAAAAETHGDTTGRIASARGMLALGQRLDRLALVEARTI